jgi:hypothetical protein
LGKKLGNKDTDTDSDKEETQKNININTDPSKKVLTFKKLKQQTKQLTANSLMTQV